MASWEDLATPVAPSSGSWEDLAVRPGGTVPPPAHARDLADSIVYGLQSSSLGLAAHGKLPDQQLDENAPWYHRLGAAAGGIVGDLPAMGLGAAAGTAVAGPGIGTTAGTFAVPMAIREALMDAYSHNYALNWSDAWEITKSALLGGTKGATIGVVTGGAGKVVEPFAAALGPTAGGAVKLAAEWVALTTAAAGVEGHLPTAQDFLDNGLLLVGAKGAGYFGSALRAKVASALRGTYAQTGRLPADVAAEARLNPQLMAQLMGESPALNRAREQNTFTGQASGAGSTVGMTQRPDTPVDRLFSNFADQARDPQQEIPFRAGMFDRANSDVKAFKNENVLTSTMPFEDGLTARIDASASGTTRVQILDGETVLGAARMKNGMIDAIAVDNAARGRGIGENLLRFLGEQGIANIREVPDRSPGFVAIQKKVLSQPLRDLSAQGVPSAYAPEALDERIRAAVGADQRPEQIRTELAPPGEPPLLGTIDATRDPVKYEYITDQDTLKGVLRATEQKYQAEIEQQTRGSVSNRESAAAGLRMIAAGDVADHVVGTAENAAEIYARGHILKGVTKNAYDAMIAIKDIPEADLTPRMKLRALASIEQLSMTLADFRGARAEAGRALQVFNKLKADAAVMGDVEQIVKMAEKKGSLQDIAKLVSSFEDPAQMQRFVEDYSKASFTDKVLEAWKAGILSGPQTHLANIMGNAAKWLIEIPESALSATITAASRAARGEPLSMAQYKARALAPLYGLQMGGADAVKVAGEVWQQKGEHLEKSDIYKTAIPGKVGEFVRIPFRALQVEDALFRTVAERAEAHIMAVDRVTAEGVLHPDTAEYREAIVKYTEHPDADLTGQDAADALKRVQDAGAEGVFSQRLGPRMEAVQRAIVGHPIQFVIPFFRTPANLVSWAVQHTPGLNLLSGRWREDFAAGGEARSRALARVAIGTGLAMTAFSMAWNGQLTGGGLFDPEQRGTKSAAGWQPYSIKIFDKYYSYQRLEPLAKVIGLAADLVELMHATKEDTDKSKIAAMLVLMFGNATVSTTYLSGLSNAMNAVLDPNRYAKNFLDQYATSLVPKIIGQAAAVMDPQKREVDGALDAIKSQIPYLREKLMPKRDVWGEPARNDKWFDVMPVAESQISQDKVKTEAVRLQVGIADAPKDAIEKGPFNPKDKKVEMSVEARDVFRYVSGHNAMEILGPIVNAPDWNRIPDFAKVEIYKRVIEGTRKQAQFAALPPDAEERMKVREKIAHEIIKQTQEAQTKP